MDEINHRVDAALDGIDEKKREYLRRMILKSAFVTPVVASFAMAGLTIDAAAQCAVNTSCTTSGRPLTTSDRSLKKDMVRIGSHDLGFGIYRFKYLWSEQDHIGVLAQEVAEVRPDAVVRGPDGFLRVDYAAIGMTPPLLPAQKSAVTVNVARAAV
jgi:Chaperone of endosialidase